MSEQLDREIRKEDYSAFTREIQSEVAEIVERVHERSEGEFSHLARNAKQQIKNNVQAALTSLMAIFNIHLHDEKAKFTKGLNSIENSYKRQIEAQNRRIRSLEEKLAQKDLGQSRVLLVDIAIFLMIFVTQLLGILDQHYAVLVFVTIVAFLVVLRIIVEIKARRIERLTHKDLEDLSSKEIELRSETTEQLGM